jgi:hypothetical protein
MKSDENGVWNMHGGENAQNRFALATYNDSAKPYPHTCGHEFIDYMMHTFSCVWGSREPNRDRGNENSFTSAK